MGDLRPGVMVSAWGEPDIRYAVVVASSRHRDCITEEQAEQIILADGLRPLRRGVWRSHTQRYLRDYGCDCEGEGWCEDGDGKAWREVVYATDVLTPITEIRRDDH